MKEKILEIFKKLGFNLEYIEELGYSFNYEGGNMLWLYNEDDENFLNISVPAVYECNEDNIAQTCALILKINSTLKYVKSYSVGTNLWLFYEREISENEDLDSVIPNMIIHLDAALKFTRDAIDEIEKICCNEDAEDNDDDDNDCCIEEIKNEENNEK